MPKSFPTLYKRDKRGNIQEWTIMVEEGGYFVTEGLQFGKKTITKPHYCEPKNTGKKNATTAQEQAEKEAQAKHDHKLAHGYSLSAANIDKTGYREPMLAKQYDDYADKLEGEEQWIDDKLNGMRCNSMKDIIQSRRGKAIHTIPHIVLSLKPVFDKYPKLFLDGELYNEKFKDNLNRLIELTSVGMKLKDLTPELLAESERIVQYHIYDGFGFEGITPETPFPERRAALKKLLKGIKYIKVLDYKTVKTKAEVKALLKEAAKNKREGLIIRYAPCPYEFKRSKYLLKAKNFIDAEFEILAVEEGNGDWAGAAKRIVLKLHKPVKDKDGETVTSFASNIEGSREWLQKMYREKKKVIGELATCEFQAYSEYGIPLISYVRSIRNYE